jgi:tetratricopeptide (TPR) repeat protein
VLLQLGRFDEALAAADRAIELVPEHGWPQAIRSVGLLQLGRFDEALAAADRAIKLSPDGGWEALYQSIRSNIDPQYQDRETIENQPVVESDDTEYNISMDQAAILEAAAEILRGGFPAERVDRALEYLLAADAPRETTDRAAAEPRPKWETDARPDEDPAHFVARAYAAEMAAGMLHRGIIRRDDPELHRRLNNWLRTHAMPEGIDIPTLPEWNTRELERRAERPRSGRRIVRTEEGKLYDAARYRTAKPT